MFGLLKNDNQELLNIDVTINRTEFNQLIEPIVKKVSDMTRRILHEIHFEPELIDQVLLVGGSSLLVAIQNQLKDLFGANKVMVHPRPMLAIAEGAAIMAAKMISVEPIFTIMHSTAHDYYLQLAGGKRHLLVARNTPLPVIVEEKLKFADSAQLLARLRVLNEIDGILEPVGELWLHKDHWEPQEAKNTEELKLCFAINEDNIITMKAWSLRDQKLRVEAQIARGGLIAKLYNDLEHALALAISKSKTFSVECDLLLLSRKVVATILAASDPITGIIHKEQKHKAQCQINTLIACQQQDLCPLSLYEFALLAQKQGSAYKVFSDLEAIKLQNIITELQQELENLADVSILEHLQNRLLNFYQEVPIAADLAKAEDAALNLAVEEYPIEARQVRNQAKQLAKVYLQHNERLFQNARAELLMLIHSMFSWSDHPSRRFDRDVVL